MKKIEIDDDIYAYIAGKTEYIGESASSILRRLLSMSDIPATAPATKIDEVEKVVTPVVQAEKVEGSIFDLINKEELATQRGAVGRFLLILSALHRLHPDEFNVVLDIKGRDRTYFAKSENEITEAGSSTKPRLIPGSEFWVITNSNTTRKKLMLTDVASKLGYAKVDVEKIRELL